MTTKTTTPLIIASALMASLSTSYGALSSVNLDGTYSGESGYTSSEELTWYNGHKTAPNSVYGDFANQTHTATIHYGVAELDGGTPGQQFFFLYIEAPLYAKNMIWQDGVDKNNYPVANTDPPLGLTETDLAPYRAHYVTHHADKGPGGVELNFKGATGSEKLILVNGSGSKVFTANLAGNADNSFGLIGFKDSVDYLFDNSISTNALSLARDTAMSFEFQFAVDQAQNEQILAYARNGLEFHLSPERGLMPPDDEGPTVIPEPGTGVLGAIGLMLILRRRKE